MKPHDLKIIIAQLLQDARRLQNLEPNAGTEARIQAAVKVFEQKNNEHAGNAISLSMGMPNEITEGMKVVRCYKNGAHVANVYLKFEAWGINSLDLEAAYWLIVKEALGYRKESDRRNS